MMDMTINFAYLFQGMRRELTHLQEETYILNALNPNVGKPGYYTHLVGNNDDLAFVSRWPENKFPLKVFAGPDYGYLFSPLELKQLTQIVQNAVARIQSIDPEVFQFEIVEDRQHADIVIKFRRADKARITHCIPEIGREKQICRAEIVLNIPRLMSSSRVLVETVHNLLHALGIYSHSENALDTAAPEWTPSQQILTPRDIKTLQLLYRCPIGMTRRDLQLLWQEYQKQHLILPKNSTLDAIISGIAADSTALRGMIQSKELSQREVALQESFSKCIQNLKTA